MLIRDEALPVILALRKLKQEDCKFEVSLGYRVRLCLERIFYMPEFGAVKVEHGVIG